MDSFKKESREVKALPEKVDMKKYFPKIKPMKSVEQKKVK